MEHLKVDEEVCQPTPFVASDVEGEIEHDENAHGHSDDWSNLIDELFVKMLTHAVFILLFRIRLWGALFAVFEPE